MHEWERVLEGIRELQLELARAIPSYDFCPVPGPAAREADLVAAEQRLGHALPPSYRSFLARHDGWPRFFHGASLLRARDIATLPKGDLIPFGADASATTLFAFDPREAKRRELPVVCYLNGIGERRGSFLDFLRLVAELCDAELEGLFAGHVAGTSVRRASA